MIYFTALKAIGFLELTSTVHKCIIGATTYCMNKLSKFIPDNQFSVEIIDEMKELLNFFIAVSIIDYDDG